MNRFIGIAIAVVVVGILGVITWTQLQGAEPSSSANYKDYDPNTIIGGNADNGNIPDHVKGNKDADIMIFEYADFQCSGCASVRTKVDELVKKYKNDIALVQRSYVLPYHTNGKAASQAAEAAGLQGYWNEYGELLFKNQNEWFSSDATERTAFFTDYFKKVTGDKGDVDKFLADSESQATADKVNFDIAMGKKVGEIYYTPAFFIDGQFVDWANTSEGKAPIINTEGKDFVEFMSGLIDAKLGK